MQEPTLHDPLRGQGPGQGLEYPPSYWTAISGTPPGDDGPLRGDRETDVAIIGGGYTGLAAAYFLAKRYCTKPVVLEANRPGWGCSGRNGGFARPVIGRFGPGAMAEKWGVEMARRMFAEGQAALDILRAVIRSENIDCDITAEGHLKIAHRPSRLVGLKAEARTLRDIYGYETQILGAEDVRKHHLGGPQSHGGLLLKDAFGLNPLKLVFGLLKAARGNGATVHASTPVVRWAKNGSIHVLHTPEGRVHARQVIIATNGYTSEGFHGATDNCLLPVLSHIIVTRSMTHAEQAEAAFQTAHILTDTRNLLYYFRRLPDNRILFGGRGQIVDSPESRTVQRAFLLAELKRKCPALEAITVDHDWAGWVCITWDKMPHIHHAADDASVLYGLGYQGSGVALSLHVGQILADRASGKPLPALPPAFSTLPRFPFAAFRRLGQRGMFLWYRFKDERD